jgi:hypothetical protein
MRARDAQFISEDPTESGLRDIPEEPMSGMKNGKNREAKLEDAAREKNAAQ